jgi:hypothetical protein
VSGEVSCIVAWDVVCPVKCRVLWLGMLCVRDRYSTSGNASKLTASR